MQTEKLEDVAKRLKEEENGQRILSDIAVLVAGISVAIVSSFLVASNEMDASNVIIATIAMMSSFGPTIALAALSNNLTHTLACGNRVLDLLQETPVVEENKNGVTHINGNISLKDVTFGYEEQVILKKIGRAHV